MYLLGWLYIGDWGLDYGGRDVSVVSMVHTFVWVGNVCGDSLLDIFSFLLGVIVLGENFCLQGCVMSACAWLWGIWFCVGERTSVEYCNCDNLKMAALGRNM